MCAVARLKGGNYTLVMYYSYKPLELNPISFSADKFAILDGELWLNSGQC